MKNLKAFLFIGICVATVWIGIGLIKGHVPLPIREIIVPEYHIVNITKEIEVVKYVEHNKVDTDKLITYLNPRIDPKIAKQIGDSVEKYSKKYQLPKKLVLSIIYKESTFNPFAKSKVAYGLMQIYPKYHKAKIASMDITDNRKLYHIDNNVNLGCWIFSEYLKKAKGNLDEAFHSYLSKNATVNFKNKYKGAILSTWAMLEYHEFKQGNGK